jgi:hypothetical protein
MQASLFNDEPDAPDGANEPRQDTRGPRPVRTDRHLSAARRLARQIRRTAPGSAEQTETGLRICRHLRAMLEAGAASPGGRRVS